MLDSIAPAIVSFTVGVGLGKMFGKKHGYKVQESQELIAQVKYIDTGEPGAERSGRVHAYKVHESQELIGQIEHIDTRFRRARS